MSLDVPQLDDSDYEELVSRARKRISAYSDAWTDFNPHDPGITILELLAWLTETHSYELDQITDHHRKKYLQLLGITPKPPQPASVRLALSPADGQAGRLPGGTQLTADDGSGTDRIFETARPITLTDAGIAAVVVDTGQGYENRTTANDTESMYYRPFGDEPTSGSAFAVGFDGDPFDSAAELSLFVDFHDGNLPDPTTGADRLAPFDPLVDFEPSVDLVWEYCQQYPDDDTQTQWETLTVAEDTTNSLYETGFVTLERPSMWEPAAWGCDDCGLFDHREGLIWIRCRLREAGYEISPQLTAVELNVVEASNRHHHTTELDPKRGRSTDLGPRTYEFDHAPVLSATVSVDGDEWTEVPDFDASGPTDCHYVLDRAAGELTVGDAEAGARPPPDATVTASYVAGGGTDGNVPSTAVWWFSDGSQSVGGQTLSEVDVSPKGAATGGHSAEPLESAVDRFKRDLQTPYRAVTQSDYAALADRTPGVRIARTAVRPPDTGEKPEVLVVVVPYAPPDVRRPTPSVGFRAAVQRYLDYHRLLTDRVTVVPPTYVGLDISVSVTITDRFADSGEQSAIATRLKSYLDPIRGFDGDGWPFGRSVSTADLRAQLTALDSVDHVEEVSIRTVGDGTVTPDGTVLIDEQTLFYVERIGIDATACRSEAN